MQGLQVPEQNTPSDVEGADASHRLNEGLKCCRSMVNDYREMIGRVVDDSFGQLSDDLSTDTDR